MIGEYMFRVIEVGNGTGYFYNPCHKHGLTNSGVCIAFLSNSERLCLLVQKYAFVSTTFGHCNTPHQYHGNAIPVSAGFYHTFAYFFHCFPILSVPKVFRTAPAQFRYECRSCRAKGPISGSGNFCTTPVHNTHSRSGWL